VSHKAFQEALTVWCNETGSQDWVCILMRSIGNLEPTFLERIIFNGCIFILLGATLFGMHMGQVWINVFMTLKGTP